MGYFTLQHYLYTLRVILLKKKIALRNHTLLSVRFFAVAVKATNSNIGGENHAVPRKHGQLPEKADAHDVVYVNIDCV